MCCSDQQGRNDLGFRVKQWLWLAVLQRPAVWELRMCTVSVSVNMPYE